MTYKNVPRRSTSEFDHYPGCKYRDPDNCSGCALTKGGYRGPNYSAWPLAYIESHRPIPAKWKRALEMETRSENKAYADNLVATILHHGVSFDDEI